MKKYVISTLALLTISLANTWAQETSSFYKLGNRIGIGVGAGTEGISIDASVSLNKYFQARIGMNIMPDFNITDDIETNPVDVSSLYPTATSPIYHQGTVDIKGSTKRTTGEVILDFYPFADKSSFFIAGGFSFGGKELATANGQVDAQTLNYIQQGKDFGFDLGDGTLLLDENGRAKATVEVSGFRPYIGIGFGRLIPKKRVGVRFEIGAQFHGKPKFKDGNGNDLLETLGQETEDDFSKIMDKLTVYPCLKLSIRGRIL